MYLKETLVLKNFRMYSSKQKIVWNFKQITYIYEILGILSFKIMNSI